MSQFLSADQFRNQNGVLETIIDHTEQAPGLIASLEPNGELTDKDITGIKQFLEIKKYFDKHSHFKEKLFHKNLLQYIQFFSADKKANLLKRLKGNPELLHNIVSAESLEDLNYWLEINENLSLTQYGDYADRYNFSIDAVIIENIRFTNSKVIVPYEVAIQSGLNDKELKENYDHYKNLLRDNRKDFLLESPLLTTLNNKYNNESGVYNKLYMYLMSLNLVTALTDEEINNLVDAFTLAPNLRTLKKYLSNEEAFNENIINNSSWSFDNRIEVKSKKYALDNNHQNLADSLTESEFQDLKNSIRRRIFSGFSTLSITVNLSRDQKTELLDLRNKVKNQLETDRKVLLSPLKEEYQRLQSFKNEIITQVDKLVQNTDNQIHELFDVNIKGKDAVAEDIKKYHEIAKEIQDTIAALKYQKAMLNDYKNQIPDNTTNFLKKWKNNIGIDVKAIENDITKLETTQKQLLDFITKAEAVAELSSKGIRKIPEANELARFHFVEAADVRIHHPVAVPVATNDFNTVYKYMEREPTTQEILNYRAQSTNIIYKIDEDKWFYCDTSVKDLNKCKIALTADEGNALNNIISEPASNDFNQRVEKIIKPAQEKINLSDKFTTKTAYVKIQTPNGQDVIKDIGTIQTTYRADGSQEMTLIAPPEETASDEEKMRYALSAAVLYLATSPNKANMRGDIQPQAARLYLAYVLLGLEESKINTDECQFKANRNRAEWYEPGMFKLGEGQKAEAMFKTPKGKELVESAKWILKNMHTLGEEVIKNHTLLHKEILENIKSNAPTEKPHTHFTPFK